MRNEDWLEECFRLMDEAKGDSQGRKWQREDLYEPVTNYGQDKKKNLRYS